MKNEYTNIEVIGDKIYVKVYDIDEVFYTCINYYSNKMINFYNAIKKDNLLDIRFFSFDIDNVDDSALVLIYSDNKLVVNYINYNEDYNSDDSSHELKPEVGYEIINKLKELLELK